MKNWLQHELADLYRDHDGNLSDWYDDAARLAVEFFYEWMDEDCHKSGEAGRLAARWVANRVREREIT